MAKLVTTFTLVALLLAASPSAARRSLLQSADAPATGEHAGQHPRAGPHLPHRAQDDQKQEDAGLAAFGDFLAQGLGVLGAILNATASLDAQASAGPGGVGAGVRMGAGAGAGPFAAGAAGSAGAAANGTAAGAGAAGRAGAVVLPGLFDGRPGAGGPTAANATDFPELEKLGQTINDTLAGLGNALTSAVSAIFPGLNINNRTAGGAPIPGSSNCDEADSGAALVNPGPNGPRPSGRPSLIVPDGNGPVPDGSGGVMGSNIERLSSVASGAGGRAARLLLSSAGAAAVLLLVA